MQIQKTLIPLLAAIAMLVLVIERVSQIEAPELLWTSAEQQDELVSAMARGKTSGYPYLLRDLLDDATLSLQLLDRDGATLAQWPPPLTDTHFGPLATSLQAMRERSWRLLGVERVAELSSGGQVYGELRGYQWRGLGVWQSKRWQDVALAGLSVWAIFLALRDPFPRSPGPTRSAQSPPVSRGQRMAVKFGAALDHAQFGLLVLNRKLQLRYANETASAWLSHPLAEVLNQSVYSALRLDREVSPAQAFSLDGHRPLSDQFDVLVSAVDGREYLLEANVLRLRDRKGDWSGMLVILQSKEAERAELARLELEEKLARRTLDALHDAVALTDRYGRVLRVNQRLNQLFSYADDELIGLGIAKLLPVPFLNEPDTQLSQYLPSHVGDCPRVVGWRKNATTFPADLHVQKLGFEDYYYLLVIRDSGERMRQDNTSMRLGRLLDYAAEGIFIFDAHSLYFTDVNRMARDKLGFSMDQLARMTPLHLAPEFHREEFEEGLAALREGRERQLNLKTTHRCADGSSYAVSMRVSYSADEEPPVFMMLTQDITEQQAAERRLQELALNDALTGLPNRAAFSPHLQQLCEAPVREMPIHLMFLDLDRFKFINDSYGHAAGDVVLQEFARRVSRRLSDNYFFARLSGDEFVIAAIDQTAEQVTNTATRLIEAMQEPVYLQDKEVAMQVCIGIAEHLPLESSSDLMRRADVAMYEAKSAGGAQFVWARKPA